MRFQSLCNTAVISEAQPTGFSVSDIAGCLTHSCGGFYPGLFILVIGFLFLLDLLTSKINLFQSKAINDTA